MYLRFSLLALFVLSAYAGNEASRDEWKAIREQSMATKAKCVEETGVDRKLLKKSFMDPNTEVDDKVKCFHACVMKAHGTINEDGTFNLTNALKRVPQNIPEREEIIDALTTCADEKGEDECETAYAIFKCVRA